MASDRKFYRTRVTIDVLSEGEPFDGDIEELAEAISSGPMVGGFIDNGGAGPRLDAHPITAKFAAELLEEFGSDSGFFGLDEDGNDVDD